MKKLSMLIFAAFFGFSFSISAQWVNGSKVKPENGWGLVALFASEMDTNTKSSLLKDDKNSVQIFGSYGKIVPNRSFAVASWYKEGFTASTPDSICIDYEFVSGNVSKIKIGLIIEDSTQKFYDFVRKEIFLTPNSWKSVSFDMSEAKKFGISSISRIHIHYELWTSDSNFGTDIKFDNLCGIYKTGSVVLIDGFGDSTLSNLVNTSTGISEGNQNPSEFVLYQNYPNPFNPSTTIKFYIPIQEFVKLSVYNLLGQEVQTLVSENKSKGSYEVAFNASNLPSGTYIYRLQAGSSVQTKKMLLVK